MPIALETIYAELKKLDQLDIVEGAIYREQAQAILANPSIALKVRTAIADLLFQANQQLMLKTVGGEDSY
jgi:hypothetical protein